MAEPVFALIFTPLLRNFVEDYPRACPKVQAFDHADDWNADAHLAALNGEIADAGRLTPKPDGKLGVNRVVAFLKENAGLALHVWRRDDRLEILPLKVVKTLVGAVESSHERP